MIATLQLYEMTLVRTKSIRFLTLCQGRAPIMWTCAIQNTSWHNHLPPQTIYHWRTSSFIVQKSSRCPRDKTNGLLLIHYLLNQSNFNKGLFRALFRNNQKLFGTKLMDYYEFVAFLNKNLLIESSGGLTLGLVYNDFVLTLHGKCIMVCYCCAFRLLVNWFRS